MYWNWQASSLLDPFTVVRSLPLRKSVCVLSSVSTLPVCLDVVLSSGFHLAVAILGRDWTVLRFLAVPGLVCQIFDTLVQHTKKDENNLHRSLRQIFCCYLSPRRAEKVAPLFGSRRCLFFSLGLPKCIVAAPVESPSSLE